MLEALGSNHTDASDKECVNFTTDDEVRFWTGQHQQYDFRHTRLCTPDDTPSVATVEEDRDEAPTISLEEREPDHPVTASPAAPPTDSEIGSSSLVSGRPPIQDDCDAPSSDEDEGSTTSSLRRNGSEDVCSEPEPLLPEDELTPSLSVVEDLPAWQIFPEDASQLYISVRESEHTRHHESERSSASATAAQKAVVIPEPSLVVCSPPVPIAPQKSALQVYHEVHRSAIRLQTFTRGYLVTVFVCSQADVKQDAHALLCASRMNCCRPGEGSSGCSRSS